MKERTALIAGATGLVGNELLQILLQEKEYERVYAIVRKSLMLKHPKLIEIVCDFDRLEEVKEYFAVDDVFCCLGTTIKKAKTREAMYKVDVEYPVTLAKLAKAQGACHFLIISSVNANVESFIWYPKMKGQLEEQIKNIPFATTSILRPSLLLGMRKEFRFFEGIAIKVVRGLSILLRRSLPSQMGIEAKIVAQAMYQIAQMNKPGVRIYSPKQMEDIIK
ncbi:NAD-dependent epimerase/dehydratase family protein [Desulforamulus aeronauticus]|uniref:NAD dependent epimerase/dehydratase family protein n=1 Tax=Desulforamulus aeronauticus DSM 10349 TaxID=1121421 RepID=A0A1M6VSR3_9FIRM|nr:NAD-dependent epimerase/dehydratase family protein [Desulforamulus aeronauticus]SHK84441.1 NAD dependent epimerase/dehydratase family protein [Desulforamulus aeronauticus DSM 10349]